MNTQNNELRNKILSSLESKKTSITLFLVNGFQIRGIITGHDDSCIVVDVEGRESMIMYGAISTIYTNPSKLVDKTN